MSEHPIAFLKVPMEANASFFPQKKRNYCVNLTEELSIASNILNEGNYFNSIHVVADFFMKWQS